MKIFDSFKQQMKKMPDQEIFIFPAENKRITYKSLDEVSLCVAKSFLAMGLKKGAHIGLWLSDVSQYPKIIFAAARIGMVVVPLNPHYPPGIVKILASFADVELLITEHYLPDYDTKVVMLSNEATEGTLSWDQFLEMGESIDKDMIDIYENNVDPEELFLIQFTSGTTAQPKAVMLKQKSILYNAKAYVKREYYVKEDIVYSACPLFHCMGSVLGLFGMLHVGYKTIFMPYFSPEQVLQQIEKERCTAFLGVPAMMNAMINHPSYDMVNLTSLEKMATGGSYCSEAFCRNAEEKLGAKIIVGYGSSETSGFASAAYLDDPAESRWSIGNALEGSQFILRDLKTLKSGEDVMEGELLIKGPGLMLGYYKDPKLTKDTIDDEGWLHTGDIAKKVYGKGYYITGRIKNLIIKGGENIVPLEIEEVILEHSNVADCACVGVPDDKFGEEIAAFLVLHNAERYEEENMRQQIQDKLGKFKVPAYIQVVEQLPMTKAGKTDIERLKTMVVQ